MFIVQAKTDITKTMTPKISEDLRVFIFPLINSDGERKLALEFVMEYSCRATGHHIPNRWEIL
jgi:hypothetical protein